MRARIVFFYAVVVAATIALLLLIETKNTFRETANEFVPDDQIQAYAASHPDQPWRLWQWWIRSDHSQFFSTHVDDIASRQSPSIQRMAAAFRDQALFLAENDPDNGIPLVLLAFYEARMGIKMVRAETGGVWTPVVVEPEHAEKAIGYLLQAAGKKKITFYKRELKQEWLDEAGYARSPKDLFVYDEATYMWMAGPGMGFYSRLTALLLGEVARRLDRAESQAAGAASPFAIIDGMQTLACRFLEDSGFLLEVYSLYNTVLDGSVQGARLLMDGNKPDDAKRIMDRGLSILQPSLHTIVPGIINDDFFDPLFMEALENQPELLNRTLRYRELYETDAGSRQLNRRINHSGISLAIKTPNLFHALPVLPTALFSEEEFVVSANFEAWGWLEWFWLRVFAPLAVIALILIFAAYHRVLCRDRRRYGTATPGNYPGIGSVFSASVRFALTAATPCLIVQLLGMEAFANPIQFHSVCILACGWSFFAASLILRMTAHRRTNPGASLKRHWLPFAGSTLLVVFALAGEHFGMLSLNKALLAVTLLAIGMALNECLTVGGWVFGVYPKFGDGDESRVGENHYAMRYFITGLAGGLILSLAGLAVVYWRTDYWRERDTLLIHRSVAETGVSDPVETRLVKYHNEHARHMRRPER